MMSGEGYLAEEQIFDGISRCSRTLGSKRMVFIASFRRYG